LEESRVWKSTLENLRRKSLLKERNRKYLKYWGLYFYPQYWGVMKTQRKDYSSKVLIRSGFKGPGISQRTFEMYGGIYLCDVEKWESRNSK